MCLLPTYEKVLPYDITCDISEMEEAIRHTDTSSMPVSVREKNHRHSLYGIPHGDRSSGAYRGSHILLY